MFLKIPVNLSTNDEFLITDEKSSRRKALENAKKSFQHWQTNSSCTLSQPNRKQEDQKTSWLKVKKNGSKIF